MSTGLRFHKLDLHTHTPASKCFGEKDVTPEMIVEAALARGLSAIAVTDHNTGEWVDCVKAAGAAKGLAVFPGVEISVNPGIHIIALFDVDCGAEHIHHVLSKLDIEPAMRGEQKALVAKHSPEAAVKCIRDQGGLPILAHIDGPSGAWEVLDGQTRIQFFNQAEYAAVEVVTALPVKLSQEPYGRTVAAFQSSDNPMPEDPRKHSHRGIGSRCSWFKLEAINLEGLRQCFAEPQLRIKTEAQYGTLRGCAMVSRVEVVGGFLDGLGLDLNADLNAIIGGRGVGKSSVIELVRYAFDAQTKTKSNADQFEKLTQYVLKPGSLVRAHFNLADGTGYCVERARDGAPTVTRAAGGDSIAAAPTDLLPLAVYGQKEVYEISKDPEFQLRLLDSYIADELQVLKKQEESLLDQLGENARIIFRHESEIDKADGDTAKLGAIREQIRRMDEQGFTDKLKQKETYDREDTLLNGADERYQEVLKRLAEAAGVQTPLHPAPMPDPLAEEHIRELPDANLFRTYRVTLAEIDRDIQETLAELRQRVEGYWKANQGLRADWQQKRIEQDKQYQALLREFQAPGQPDAALYIKLQREAARLENLQTTAQRMRGEITAFQTARQALLDQLAATRQKQTQLRRDKVGQLTKRLNPHVKVKVIAAGIRSAYVDFLQILLKGSGVRTDTVEIIVEAKAQPESPNPYDVRYLSSRDLAQAIRAEQQIRDKVIALPPGVKSPLEAQFGVESVKMRANLASLSEEKLFEMEAYGVPDKPEILLKVGNHDRALDQLSVGQRCTAVLSLILLESDFPLLIDQPEDDLDNQFIFDQIVSTLRREKERRQFVIATHNANIPVSGDAELIVVLDANQDRGTVVCTGSIDSAAIKEHVERILEGGADAFRIRKDKYGLK